MGAWVWVGFLAFFVVALVVGVRVLLLASRTHELPELLMGIGVLGIGPVGFGLLVVGQQVRSSHPEIHPVVVACALLAISAGVMAKFVFNWRVYHPSSAIARGVTVTAAVGLVATFLYSGLVHGFSDVGPTNPQSLVRTGLQVGCLLWGAAESFVYFGKMRRRVGLGLGDPVVANRFLMWAVGAFAAGWGTLVGTVAQIVSGTQMAESPAVMASSSLHGLVAAVAIALAFIPPRAYVRYIRSRAV